jgi:hypothetical protein
LELAFFRVSTNSFLVWIQATGLCFKKICSILFSKIKIKDMNMQLFAEVKLYIKKKKSVLRAACTDAVFHT